MKKKVYFIQPSYRDRNGRLLQGQRLFMHSLALPALSAAVPPDWEKQFCLEFFEDIDWETDAGVVGISCMCYDIFRGLEIAREFKKRGKVVIFGGAPAQLWKKLAIPIADAVVYGNVGPQEMKELLDDAAGGQLRREYQFGMNVDFPFDYSLLAGRKISCLPLLASIGCHNRCEFCSTATMIKGRYHLRSMDVVLEDMRKVRLRMRRAMIVDANLYNDREHLARLCERMIAEDFGFIWGAECTPNVGDDPELLRLLARSGCRLLMLGFESISQSNLRDMGKPNLVRRYAGQISNIRKAGISVAGLFIFGFDGDDHSTVDEMFRFIHDSRICLPSVNLLTPVPGTTLFERLQHEGRMLMDDEADFLRQNLHTSPMYRCYFVPRQMHPREVEQDMLQLRQRLYSLYEIARRCLVPDPVVAGVLFLWNLRYRAETKQIARALREKPARVKKRRFLAASGGTSPGSRG